jgi:hypothetical protein
MMGFDMFEPLYRGESNWEIRTENGIAHIREHEDGTWTVAEDPDHTRFPNRGAAFDRVRRIMKVQS